ncbi:MAG: hypothetical protein WC380_00600 [Pedobacter sp.]|jgi:hypothetical protein
MRGSEVNYVYLIQKIDGFIRKYYLNKIVKGAIFMISSLLAAYILIAIAEYLGHFSQNIRSVLFYTFICGNLFVLISYIILPLLSYYKLGKTISHEQAATIIGQHFSHVKDKLINTLQLKQLSELKPDQRTLIEASINQKIAELRPVPFSSAIHISNNRKYLKYVLAPIAILILIFFASPSILSESTERLIYHNRNFVKKAPFTFEIINKDLSVVQGSDFELRVKLNGHEIPAELFLEDGPNTYKLNKENILNFNYSFKNLQKNKKIRLSAGGFNSQEFQIEVKPKPSLLNFDVFINYPAYLNKSNEKFENTGDLLIPEGSSITWKFRADNSEQLDVKIENKSFLIRESEKNLFSFSHQARKDISYEVRPINKDIRSSESFTYQIKVIPDLLPVIEVSERQDSVNSKLLYFIGQVNDDHGFTKLNFNYRILSADSQSNEKTQSKSIQFDKNGLQSTFYHVWNATEARASAGDQIEYYFEIFDNDGVNGPKAVRSIVKTFKLPSEKEISKELEDNGKQIKEKMESAIKEASKLEKETKRLNQDLLNKKELSYEEKKRMENLLQKQKELENLVKEIQQENKQNIFELKENSEQNEKILEKQKQIEELFNNVLDEKTREILKNIEKLLEKNNKNLTQEELSKMQMDNKSLQKELDRILELYKQLEFDQKLTEAIEKLNKLAKEQKDLSDKTQDKGTDNQQLKREQNEINDAFKELKEELNKLEEKNNELGQKNDFKNPEQEQEQIEQQQRNISENLIKKEMNKAAENQKKVSSQMEQLSKKLENMQEEAEEKENEINARELREILDNLLFSSFEQEKTMQNLRSININDPGYILQTQKQKDIQINLKMIEDSLYSLSKKVPQIQSVVNKEMQIINHNIIKAIENLGERRTAEANRSQQFALTSINNLALMLNEALEQLQQAQQNSRPGGKGKKKQSLSQLSKMQEQLNQNMQKAREEMQKRGMQNSGQQGNPNSTMSEQLAKMAREQQMIRQAMQEINRMENKNGKGSLGNLDKLMKEMEQTETDLVNKRIQQETLVRQKEILSKLLEAEKAEREREQDELRESKEASQLAPVNSLLLQEYQKIKQKETDLLKTIPPSLNTFYKIKVGDYFKYLNSGNK